MVFNEFNGNVCDYARPELVYNGGEGYWSVVVHEVRIALLVYECSMTRQPCRGCEALLGHAFKEQH